MKIAILNPPYRDYSVGGWITVPPTGYGGIQWIVAHLIDGFLALKHQIVLIGAPQSKWVDRRVQVSTHLTWGAYREANDLRDIDIIHDHSNHLLEGITDGIPTIRTHHLAEIPISKVNVVYSSYAQRGILGKGNEPVVRIPVNPDRYKFGVDKDDFLLCLSRVSPWKGVLEAAKFAQLASYPLIVAGPSWEANYLDRILKEFPQTVTYIGEIGGDKRKHLLSRAKAVLVFSQPLPGPNVALWSEPGSTVVSEAGASGTPVIASSNGCLAEIVPPIGVCIDSVEHLAGAARDIVANLGESKDIFECTVANWGHLAIASQYVAIYENALAGKMW